MAKHKIKKNLTDAQMLKAFAEESGESFEQKMLKHDDGITRQPRFKSKKVSSGALEKDEFYREFLTDKVETEIGKTLLAIKMEYFRDGVSDFSLQVRKDGKNIVLETKPKKYR